MTATRDKAYVLTDKRYEKERDTGIQNWDNIRRRIGGECMNTLRGGWPYRATQIECMILRPDKDDEPKGVGSKTNVKEGSGVQR